MRPSGSLDSFSTILAGLSKRLGLQSHLFELRLQQQWREIIGEPVGSHTWPAQVRFKKLYLIVRNSVWLQQLVFLKPTLLAKLNDRAGAEMLRTSPSVWGRFRMFVPWSRSHRPKASR